MEEKIVGLEAMMSSGNASKDKGPSEAYFYGEEIEANENVSKRKGDIYRWNGSFWNLQEKVDEETKAYKWLEIGRPSRCTPKNAKDLATTATYKARDLPQVPSDLVVIPTKNIYIKLEDGKFVAIKPDRKLGMTYGLNIDRKVDVGPYSPKKVPEDSLFGKFLSSSLPIEGVRNAVQEYIGYTLIHDTRFQVWQCWYGGGSNGKSVMARIVKKLHRKVSSVEMDKLEGFEMEDIVDASLILVDEAPERHINADKLKRLISGELCKINRKNKLNVSTEINAKWIVCTNHKFKVTDTSDGWYRRFVPIPWNQSFKGKDIVRNLDDKIVKDEMEIVLDWALEGLQRLMERGFFEYCEDIERLKDEFRIATDSVRAWIHDNEIRVCDDWENQRVPKDQVYREYCDWCMATNRKSSIVLDTKFFERLYNHFDGLQDQITRPRINGKQVPHIPLVINGQERSVPPEFDTGYSFSKEKVVPIKVAAGTRF